MSYYVMVVPYNDTEEEWFFAGPFKTDMDAWAWGDQQDDVHPSWHVLDLDDPAVEPRVLPPTMRTPATVEPMRPVATGESGIYILCWTETSYHLIGPFEDNGQCPDALNWYDVHPDFDDPCNDTRWAVLLLDVPPSPRVVRPTTPPLSEDEVQQRRETFAKESEILKSAGSRRNLSAWPGPSFLHSCRAVSEIEPGDLSDDARVD
jgi:hypothetical protein